MTSMLILFLCALITTKVLCNDVVLLTFKNTDDKTITLDFTTDEVVVVVTPPINELVENNDSTLRMVTINNIAPHSGVCIGISVSDHEDFDGCVGDLSACVKNDKLVSCMHRTVVESNIRVFESYNTLKLLVYTSKADTQPQVSFLINTLLSAPSACPDMSFYYSTTEDSFRLVIGANNTDVYSGVYVYIENMDFYRELAWYDANTTNGLSLTTSFSQLYLKMHTHLSPNNRMIVNIPSISCIAAFDIETDLFKSIPEWQQIAQSMAFDVDFYVSMRPPSLQVAVSPPIINPLVNINDLLLFYLLYESDGDILVSSTTLQGSSNATALLEIKSCNRTHYVTLQVMYIDGSMLLTRKKEFSPDVFCARFNMSVDCFCVTSSLLMTVDPILTYEPSIVFPPANISSIPLASYPYDDILVNTTGIVSYYDVDLVACYALNLDTGEKINALKWKTLPNTTDELTCVYYLPSKKSHYRIVHGSTVFENVLVCSTGSRDVKYITTLADSISYILVNTGIVCPVVDHSGTVYKSQYTTKVVVSNLPDSQGLTDIQYDENANQVYLWFPPLGHHEISICHNDELIDALTVDVNKDLSLIPVYCSQKHVSLTHNHLPRFPTDHTAFADIAIIHKQENYVYSLQIIKNGVVGNWLQIRRVVTSILLESGTHYRFTVMVQQKNSVESALVTSVCYDSAGQINPLPEISIDILSPINIVSCDDSVLVVFKATTNTPSELSGVVPFAYNEDIHIDIYSRSDFIYIAGPLNPEYLEAYVTGALVLEFKFGTQGQVVVNTLDEILTNKLYVFETSLLTLNEQGYDYKSSRILANTCKPHVINTLEAAPSSDCVPLAAHFEVVEDDYKNWNNHDIICNGKRLFRIVFDISSSKLTYKTNNDRDLGSTVLTDNAVFALDAKRDDPVYVYSYYNPLSSKYMGVEIKQCIGTLSPPSKDKLVWSFNMPQIKILSSYESSCGIKDKQSLLMRIQKPQQQTSQIGGFILQVADDLGNFAGGVQTYTLSLESAVTRVPVIARSKSPWFPMQSTAAKKKGALIYSGLDSGAYVAKLAVTDFLINATGYTCNTREMLFVEPTTDAFSLDDIIDFNETSTGAKSTLCPKDMYADTNSWLQYYQLTLNSKFINKYADNKVLTVNIWEKTTSALIKSTQMITPTHVETSQQLRLPRPGTYIAELILLNTKHNTQCSHHLPEYKISDPQFDRSSFVAEVINYPTCADSDDGLIRISYPSYITDVIATATVCQLYFNPSATCVRDVVIDESQSSQGAIFIKNAPYMSRLSISFEIHSACVFTSDFTVVPESATAYMLTGIKYRPTCTSRFHMFEPVFYNIANKHVFEDYGINEATWSLDSDTLLSNELSYVFDPASWLSLKNLSYYTDKTIDLMITYNDRKCTSTFSANTDEFIPKMFVSPDVKIDPILFEFEKSRSLPVYCPHSSDAALVASVYPPLTSKLEARNRLTWRVVNGNNVSSENTAILDQNTVTAFALQGGFTYSLEYSSGPCVAVDFVTVPEKKQFNILNHLVIENAHCSGLDGRAYIETGDKSVHTGCEQPEVSVFTSDMIISGKDRVYLDDHGSGATSFENVPDGTVIRMKIPYNPRYQSKKPFCDALMEIDFGKISPLPVIAYVQNTKEPYPIKLYTPRWISLSLNNTCAIDQTDILAADWDFSLQPLSQLMDCPYSQPSPVSVYKVNTKTSDRFFMHRYADPLSFYSDLSAMDSNFNITFPPFVDISITDDVTIIDAHCNRDPFMFIGIVIDQQSLQGIYSINKQMITVDNKPVDCYLDQTAPTISIVCRVPRVDVFYMRIPYTSSTMGSCMLTVPIYYIVSDLKYFVPKVIVDHESMQACLVKYMEDDNNTFYCFNFTDGYGVYNISNSDTCRYEYSVIVSEPHKSSVVQIINPSCAGASDGAVVWKLPNETIVTRDFLPTGLYYVEYSDVENNTIVIDGVYLWDAEPVSYIVQPKGFPAPPYKKDAAEVVGLPYSMSDPLEILIYIRGGSELLDIRIIGSKTNGAAIYPECILRYYENIYWTYICNSTLLPGYSYTFDVDCAADFDRRVNKRRPTAITMLEKLALIVTDVVQPSTVVSKDGSFRVEIIGGVPPFTVIFENSAYSTKQLTRYIINDAISSSSSGIYHVTVIDSTGSLVSIDVTLFPVTTFIILSLQIQEQKGCGMFTTSYIKVELNDQLKADALGAWNQASHESPIASCSDKRVIATKDNVVVVGEAGDWYVVVCYGNEITAISDTSVTVPMQEQTLKVSLTNQGTMTYCQKKSNGQFVVVDQVKLNIASSKGFVKVRNKQGNEIEMDRGYVFKILPTGLYTFYVSDESDCDIEVKVMIKFLSDYTECQ